jgi:hypothetical protein
MAKKLLGIALCLGLGVALAADERSILSDLAPERWRQPGVWHFYVVDEENRELGRISLLLTGEQVSSDSCVDDYWKKAIVMDSDVDFDFGVDMSPAYHLNGPWLTVELTSSSCSLRHRFVGDATEDGATGSFHYIHSLNAQIIGSFTAKPTIKVD